MSISPLQALEEAVRRAGGQSALARKLGNKANGKPVTQQDVWGWLNLYEHVTPENVLKIEAATGVPKEQLRPDIYPTK